MDTNTENRTIEPLKLEHAIDDMMAKKRKIYPCHTNRSSSIGHECVRHLVFARTRWQDQLMYDVGLQYIFEEGNFHEGAIYDVLGQAGFTVSQTQRAYHDRTYNISAHIDGMLSHKELLPWEVPFDAKSMSMFIFDSISSYRDIVEHPQHHVRKYIAQLQMYLYFTECEHGLFILKNKQTGKLKFIVAHLDYDFCEELLKKAERINQAVIDYDETGNVTDETTEDATICLSCPYRHICFGSKEPTGRGIAVLQNALVDQHLYRMAEIEEIAKEYLDKKEQVNTILKERADEEIKTKKGTIIVGDWVATLSKIKQKRVQLPDDVKEQYKVESEYWKVGKIEKL